MLLAADQLFPIVYVGEEPEEVVAAEKTLGMMITQINQGLGMETLGHLTMEKVLSFDLELELGFAWSQVYGILNHDQD